MQDKTLLPQRRRRSLAELDARIAGAEANQAKAAQATPLGRRAIALAGVALRFADERLALLRRSRAVLTGKEPPD